MKNAIIINTEARPVYKTIIPAKSQANLLGDIKVLTCLLVAVAALNMLWFAFDFHVPTQDEAEHIMNSMVGCDLLHHFHPWRLHWWYQVLTINSYYPPVSYLVNGFFMLLLGQSRTTDQIALTFFLCLAGGSVYGIVRLLKGSRFAAGLSVFILIMYPLVTFLGHNFFLDLPELAMAAFSLLTLLWWRNGEKPDWRKTIVTGFVLGVSCLTKQLVAAYLLPVGLYFLLDFAGLIYPLKKPRWAWLWHVVTVGLITAAIGLPFIWINYKPTHNMTSMIMGDFAQKNVQVTYLDRVLAYMRWLHYILTPVLLALFLASLASAKKTHWIKLLPVFLSWLGGMVLTFAWPGNAVDPRYLAPALIAPAISTGFLLEYLYMHDKVGWQIFAEVVVAFIGLQYFCSNFIPYPCTGANCEKDFFRVTMARNPTPERDWGESSVIQTIMGNPHNGQVYLNVLTNSGNLHPHAFELLLKEKGCNWINPITCRQFTIFGDKVSFNKEGALQSQWYLWKTGTVGYNFFDKASTENFQKVVKFVRESGAYKVMLEKKLPDGSELMLYKKI